MRLSLVLPSLVALVVISHAAHAAREVFNDDRPETHALEIWRMTHDPLKRHHSVYHNVDPFSPTGRYLYYTEVPTHGGYTPADACETLVVYDLLLDREIWRSPAPVVWPIWAHRSDAIYWADGRKGKPQSVWRVEIPSGEMTKICDGLLNAVTGISPDDRYLFATYNQVFRIGTEPGAEIESLWAHPEAPAVSSSLVCHNPTKPVFQVRQNPAMLKDEPRRWNRQYPARMLVTDEGEMLGPALSSLEQGHGAWRGDGEYLIRGDGLLSGRPWNQPWPVPLLTYANTLAHDPSPCGRSGQWTCTTDGINDVLKRFDWRTTDTVVMSYSASIIHQPLGDNADRSGSYDSDAHGSPDGTKIYFSTNYQLDEYPVTLITGNPDDDTIEVLSTAGFPDQGYLSVHVGVISYTGKTPTTFTGIERGALGSRVGPSPEGFTASNLAGRADLTAENPLATQYDTDVYLAVVKLPDPPALVRDGDRLVLYPGLNHRETRGYELTLDGRPLTEAPWDGQTPLTVPAGELRARAVEWSGLASDWTLAMAAPAGELRYEPTRPAELDAPVREEVERDGQRIVRLIDPKGTLLTEETYVGDALRQRAEYTPDGRVTLVVEYEGGHPARRIIRDPQERLRRIEHLDGEGYLTKVEDYADGALLLVTEYEERLPVRIRSAKQGMAVVRVNREWNWEMAE